MRWTVMIGGRNSHDDALRVGWDSLKECGIGEFSLAGATVGTDASQLKLKVMDRVCRIDLSSERMSYEDGEREDVSAYLRILTLHYLVGARDKSPSGVMVSFREFEGGALYYSAFKKRTIDVLTGTFGDDADSLRRAGERLGATTLSSGSVSFRVKFFPKLPVDVLFWLGDEEVPSSANILFDETAGKMIATEDLSALAGALCIRLIKSSSKAEPVGSK
ncbi:MAG: DUF3786 domain-containing protein [Methanomassiliicoccus sp.]|nr:MAG: DUF3786 domain-containing protein [Methanomassiliicoccus sp.]